MTVKERTVKKYWVVCDGKCGRRTLTHSKELKALLDAAEYGWVREGDKDYCVECYGEREEHND